MNYCEIFVSGLSIFSKTWVNTDCLKFWMKLNYFSKVCWKKLLFIGRTDVEAEAPILWPPDVKSRLIRKDPDAGKDWRQKEKQATEVETVRWHQWTCIWANSGRQWRTGQPGVLQSMGSQRAGHDLGNEQHHRRCRAFNKKSWDIHTKSNDKHLTVKKPSYQ